MDPNEALRNLRDAYSRWEDAVGDHTGEHIDAGSDLRDAAVALDEWLSRGGFLPEAWNRDRVGWARGELGARPGEQDYDDDDD